MHALVTLTAGATSKALVPLATVKAQLGISGAAEDAELERLTAAAGLAVAGVHGLRRPPWRQTYDVRLPGDGGLFLLPPLWPIESLARILHGIDSPSEVPTADYTIEGEHRDRIYKPGRWAHSSRVGADSDFPYLLEGLVAGWLMPEQVTAWAPTSAAPAGSWRRPTTSATPAAQLLRFECTAGGGGNTGATEPTWPTTPGDDVVDGAVTWTARRASELTDSHPISQAALLTVQAWYDGELASPIGVSSERHGGTAVDYAAANSPLPPVAELLLADYRNP